MNKHYSRSALRNLLFTFICKSAKIKRHLVTNSGIVCRHVLRGRRETQNRTNKRHAPINPAELYLTFRLRSERWECCNNGLERKRGHRADPRTARQSFDSRRLVERLRKTKAHKQRQAISPRHLAPGTNLHVLQRGRATRRTRQRRRERVIVVGHV